VPGRGHIDEHGVATGDQQRQVRKRWRVDLEQRRQQMPFEVMNRNRGHFPRVGQRPAECGAGQQRSDQAGAGGVGHAVDLAGRCFRIGQRGLEQGQQPAHVIP
jgi:hypothetical protein